MFLSADIEILSAVLADGTEEERIEAIQRLAVYSDSDALNKLVEHIPAETSAYVRRKLISALGTKRDEQVARIVAPLLESNQAHVRGVARAILTSLGNVTVDTLARMFRSDSRDTRKQVIDVLAEIPGDGAFELLVGGIYDPDCVVVSGCTDALRQRGDRRAIAHLSQRLTSLPVTWVGFSIIEALAAFDDSDNITVITNYLTAVNSPSDRAVLAGAWADAAGRAGYVDALPLALQFHKEGALPTSDLLGLVARLSRLSPSIGEGNPTLLTLVRKELREGSGESLWNAAELAANLCRDKLWRELPRLAVLAGCSEERNPDTDEVRRLVEIIRQARVSSEELTALLRYDSKVIVDIALTVAESGPYVLAIDELSKVYLSAETETAIRAVRLAARAGDGAAGLIMEVITNEKAEELVLAAIEGAAELAPDVAGPILLKAIIHPFPCVRELAVNILIAKQIAELYEQLADKLTDAYGHAWAEILAALSAAGKEGLDAYWMQAATFYHSSSRTSLAKYARYIADEELFLKISRTLANDPDSGVRRMAIASLAERGGEKVSDLLSYLYENDPERRHRYLILSCSEILRHPNALAWLRENLTTGDPLLRAAAIRGLVNSGREGAKILAEAIKVCPNDECLQEMMEEI